MIMVTWGSPLLRKPPFFGAKSQSPSGFLKSGWPENPWTTTEVCWGNPQEKMDLFQWADDWRVHQLRNGWIRMAEWTTCESHPRCTSKYTKHQGFLETLVNSHSLLVKVAIEVVLPIKHADCPSFFQVCLQEVMFWRRISDQWSMVISGHPVFHAKKRGVDSNHLWLVVLYNHLEEWWTSSMGRINDIPQIHEMEILKFHGLKPPTRP